MSDDHINSYNAFKRDTNYVGEDVEMYSEIESWQRAKRLSLTYQRKLRLQIIESLKEYARNNVTMIQSKYNDIHTNKMDCITNLLNVINPSAIPIPHKKIQA